MAQLFYCFNSNFGYNYYMKTTAQHFMDLLQLFGHDGDLGCMMMIEEKVSEGVAAAAKHYSNYLTKVTVKKVTPAEVTKLIKEGKTVWTTKGFITKSKFNVPQHNGVLLLNDHMTKLLTDLVIIF